MSKDITLVRQRSPIKIVQIRKKQDIKPPKLYEYTLVDGTRLFKLQEQPDKIQGYKQSGNLLENESESINMTIQETARQSYEKYLNKCMDPKIIVYWTEQTKDIMKKKWFREIWQSTLLNIRHIFVYFDQNTPFLLIHDYIWIVIINKSKKYTWPHQMIELMKYEVANLTDDVMLVMIDILLHFPHLINNKIRELVYMAGKLDREFVKKYVDDRKKGKDYKLPLDICIQTVQFKTAGFTNISISNGHSKISQNPSKVTQSPTKEQKQSSIVEDKLGLGSKQRSANIQINLQSASTKSNNQFVSKISKKQPTVQNPSPIMDNNTPTPSISKKQPTVHNPSPIMNNSTLTPQISKKQPTAQQRN